MMAFLENSILPEIEKTIEQKAIEQKKIFLKTSLPLVALPYLGLFRYHQF